MIREIEGYQAYCRQKDKLIRVGEDTPDLVCFDGCEEFPITEGYRTFGPIDAGEIEGKTRIIVRTCGFFSAWSSMEE